MKRSITLAIIVLFILSNGMSSSYAYTPYDCSEEQAQSAEAEAALADAEAGLDQARQQFADAYADLAAAQAALAAAAQAEADAHEALVDALQQRQQNDMRSIQLSQIKTSTAFILSGDCTAAQWHLPPYGTATTKYDDCDKDDSKTKCLSFFGESEGMNVHRFGNNVLFADFHVAPYKAWDPAALTYSPHAMQGYDDVTAD